MHKKHVPKTLTLKSIRAGKPTLIVAAPGSNVEELTQSISQELKLPLLTLGMRALDDAESQKENAIPHAKDTKPGWFPSKPTLMVLDKVNNADSKETEYAYELIMQNSLKEMQLPEGSVVIATVMPENVTDIRIPDEFLKACRIVTLPATSKEEK